MSTRLARLPRVKELTGLGTTSVYGHVARGLLPPPIKITERCSAWVEPEIDAVIHARIAGQDDETIRDLVAKLVADRTAQQATR